MYNKTHTYTLREGEVERNSSLYAFSSADDIRWLLMHVLFSLSLFESQTFHIYKYISYIRTRTHPPFLLMLPLSLFTFQFSALCKIHSTDVVQTCRCIHGIMLFTYASKSAYSSQTAGTVLCEHYEFVIGIFFSLSFFRSSMLCHECMYMMAIYPGKRITRINLFSNSFYLFPFYSHLSSLLSVYLSHSIQTYSTAFLRIILEQRF